MTTLSEIFNHLRNALASGGIEDPATEARILLGGRLGLERKDFITKSDMLVAAENEAWMQDAVARRLAGEPPYRILGQRGFYGLEFTLGSATLEPRPDTEILVETVLELVQERKDQPMRILDLGTGTGAICQALLAHLPEALGVGSDISKGALKTALANARLNGLSERFTALESDWFGAVSGRFDIIVSNPPYISSAMVAGLDREVRDHDPMLALDGGVDGLDAYRILAEGAGAHLAEAGIIAVETGFDQRDDVLGIFANHGFRLLRAVKDYGGNDRVQAFCAEM